MARRFTLPRYAMDPHLRSAPVTRPIQAALDRVTTLAAEVLHVEAACASLVVVAEGRRRLVTSSHGLPVATALLLTHAFRKHVAPSRPPLVVADGQCDPLVMDNPAVRDGLVRSCVGIPLGATAGAVGMLLAMDGKPRCWTAAELELLGRLRALIASELEFWDAVRRTPPRRNHRAYGIRVTPATLLLG